MYWAIRHCISLSFSLSIALSPSLLRFFLRVTCKYMSHNSPLNNTGSHEIYGWSRARVGLGIVRVYGPWEIWTKSPKCHGHMMQRARHVGLFETYRYKRTGQIFIWNYIGNWFVFSKYLDNYCRCQYCANDTLFRNISCILPSIFQDTLPKKDVAFCETTDTAHSYIKQIVNFSEINVSIDAKNGLTKNCFRILVLCKGTE